MTAGSRLSRDDVERLYLTFAARVQAYLMRQVGHPAVAADLLQETFVRLLQAPPSAGSEAELRAYVYRTAHSRAVDHLRRGKRQAQLPSHSAEPTTSPASSATDMERAFAALAPRDRSLLWLAYVEEMRHNEIASVLGVQTLSVKVLLYRARKRLEKILRRHGLEPEFAS